MVCNTSKQKRQPNIHIWKITTLNHENVTLQIKISFWLEVVPIVLVFGFVGDHYIYHYVVLTNYDTIEKNAA